MTLKKVAQSVESLIRWLAVDPETLEIKTALDNRGAVMVVKGRAGEAGRLIGTGGVVIRSLQTIATIASHDRLLLELINPTVTKGPPLPDNQWPLPPNLAPLASVVRTLVATVAPDVKVKVLGVENAWIVSVVARSWSPELDQMVKALDKVLMAIARARRGTIKVLLEVEDAVLQQGDTGRSAGS